jgi:hypothetical protein
LLPSISPVFFANERLRGKFEEFGLDQVDAETPEEVADYEAVETPPSQTGRGKDRLGRRWQSLTGS